MKHLVLITTIVILLLGCKEEEDTNSSLGTSRPNILLIIADDLGKDALNGFSEGSIKPNTPHIDALRSSGLIFTNFWSYPTCSPTRSSILTGKYGLRTGVQWASDILSPSELSLQSYIDQESDTEYATALVGKWHLSGDNTELNPESFGIDYYAGLIRGEAQSYYNWLLTEDGNNSLTTEYTTTTFTNLAIDWISNQSQPWFLWLAYNAPHTPFHVPPVGSHSQGDLPPYEEGLDPTPYYMAAIESMDHHIGNLFDTMSSEVLNNTLIIFLGDNGSPNEVAQLPFLNTTAKGTLYQGGVNVPMFASGSGITRKGLDNNLITSTDLFSTIANVAGVKAETFSDSKSFFPLFSQNAFIRGFQFAERKNGQVEKWAISNGAFKLIENAIGNQELYNLIDDPYEEVNLMDTELTTEENNALSDLENQATLIRQ